MNKYNEASLKLIDAIKIFSPFENSKRCHYPGNRYILRRNVAGFPFGDKLSTKDSKILNEKITSNLASIYPDGLLFQAADICSHTFHLLFEHLFIANRESIRNEGAIFIDSKNNLIALIHLDNHLTVFMHDRFENDCNILEKLSSIDLEIGKRLPFAFSTKFGFITSSVLNLGTGLTLEAMIHAPGISFLKESLPESDKIQVFGLNNEKEVLHNLLILSNKYHLGISEKNNNKFLNEVANGVLKQEMEIKQKIKDNPKKKYENLILKNFGILKYCKSLSFHESLELASILDFGISMDYIESSHKTLFFDLFFSLRRAHLETFYNDDNSPIEEKRANFLREKTKDLKLTV